MRWYSLSEEERVVYRAEIARRYDIAFERAGDLCKEYGISHTGLYRVLHKAGVDTSKGRRYSGKCHACGVIVERTKSQMRGRRRIFCNQECYFEWISEVGSGYTASRHGQRLGRSIVSRYFSLVGAMIVHHEDRNTLNNAPFNLRVFLNHSEHMSYHRGGEGKPIWDGSRDVPEFERYGSWEGVATR